jgi:DNA replication protein DnaC
MKNNFSPSINIIRDQEKDFAYITTPNSERVIEQLNKNVLSGIKSFYLVGSFGTGKSSFCRIASGRMISGLL